MLVPVVKRMDKETDKVKSKSATSEKRTEALTGDLAYFPVDVPADMEKWAEQIGGIALESMLFEAAATPKPGLVDRANNGAHWDMDYFTFMSSAAALRSTFDDLARAGLQLRDRPVKELLPELRRIGRQAEKSMFFYTRGINTHKGMIFSLGMLCGVSGWYFGKGAMNADELCRLTAEMCDGICERELLPLSGSGLLPKDGEKNFLSGKEEILTSEPEALTKGEQVYLRYGVKGVRGEVESGYLTVRTISLPIYRKLRDAHCDLNTALVQTLLHLIAGTADTNILSRHGIEAAEFARSSAEEVLKKGGALTEEGMKAVRELDQTFIKQDISPGGCADLLAVTHYLYKVSQRDAANDSGVKEAQQNPQQASQRDAANDSEKRVICCVPMTHLTHLTHLTQVSLEDMLECREDRARLQQEFLGRYGLPLVSFCMNIPGPVKTNERIRAAFDLGKDRLLSRLPVQPSACVEKHERTGDELLLAVDLPAPELKRIAITIEDDGPVGRLFDMDVIDTDGRKLSRPEPRRCIICKAVAQECARSRRHTVADMQRAVEEILRTAF